MLFFKADCTAEGKSATSGRTASLAARPPAPMANHHPHEDVMRAFLEDPGLDLAGCASVPWTPEMAT